ncbi:kinase-like protein [Clavulina sp. PMI_390]|nr:kinase-like protein [Clavulina sp. PMI_390]
MIDNVTYYREKLVGRGGEASVFEGEWRGSPVVVREVNLENRLWDGPAGLRIKRLVRREAITHSQLRHPNILPFRGVYCDPSTERPLTVSPFIERGSLQNLIEEDGEISFTMFQHVVSAFKDNIYYLHSRSPPVIHGDLHPGNILIDDSGVPYICDFGLSRIRYEVTRSRTQSPGAVTKSRFRAPEISTEEGADKSTQESDIFSLSLTFLALWSGKKPFPHLNEFAVVTQIADGRRPKRPKNFAIVPANDGKILWALLEDMWKHHPTKRPSSYIVVERLKRLFPQAIGSHLGS